MSLKIYENNESLSILNAAQYGQIFNDKIIEYVDSIITYPNPLILEEYKQRLSSEIHIYSFESDYIGGIYDLPIEMDKLSKSIIIDTNRVFTHNNITNGTYKLSFNLLYHLFGSYSNNNPLAEERKCLVKEISPDRTEIKIVLNSDSFLNEFSAFKKYIRSLSKQDLLNYIVVNFGKNQIYNIANIRFDKNDNFTFYVKVHKPIEEIVEELSDVIIDVSLSDPYIDSILLIPLELPIDGYKLQSPNFDVEVDEFNSQSTMFQNWNDLLNTNINSAQNIIDSMLSGSNEATLNIDYTYFENFVFYSSAKERIENFHYKMEMIETFKTANEDIVNNTTGSLFNYDLQTITNNERSISTIINGFDPFERWLYYDDNTPLFTHDLLGPVKSYPKYVSGQELLSHSTNSLEAKAWRRDMVSLADEYDSQNVNSLWWSIPEHVLMDVNNSEYVTFVNMIGHHFDTMYSYINELTSIHSRDEHSKRGPSSDLLYYIAKHFGWDLQNTNQLSDLWHYKLGKNDDGSNIETSSGNHGTHEDQTKQIWRRIVNNLPYLLKNKGTSRSVKALMSIYGIPQTLISIKEYGGPGLKYDKTTQPLFVEDVFAYSLILPTSNNEHIRIPQEKISVKEYGWGDGSWCKNVSGSLRHNVLPRTYEFRFAVNKSINYENGTILFTQAFSDDEVIHFDSPEVINNLSIIPSIATGEEFISGSNKYGKLIFNTTANTAFHYGESEWLPIYDGDFWTVRLTTTDTDYIVQISRAADCLYGNITQEDKFFVDIHGNHSAFNTVFLGTHPQIISQINNNISSLANATVAKEHEIYIQGYKEYYTTYSDETFYNHVRNPRSYNTDSISGSFYSLYRYIPFGLDLQRENRAIDNYESSSHPDRSINPAPIEYKNFVGTQETQFKIVNETFYSEVPVIGGTTINNDKIRLEDSHLRYELDPENRSELSEFDEAPTDSNKLAIVFSVADQINRDIINHMGYGNLDNFIGSPSHTYDIEYNQLQNISNEYFQKYQQYNDINAFIRILSLYDYTFFEQIKQLVPGRADLIAGILIEPHILNRSKVTLMKKPKVFNRKYEKLLQYKRKTVGKYLTHNGIHKIDHFATICDLNYSGSIELDRTADIELNYNSGSIKDFIQFKTKITDIPDKGKIKCITDFKMKNHDVIHSIIDVSVSGSGDKITPIDKSMPDCRYKEKKCYFYPYILKDCIIQNPTLNTTSKWNVLGSHTTPFNIEKFNNIRQSRLKHGIEIEQNTNISQVCNLKTGKYKLIFHARPSVNGSNDGYVNSSITIIIENDDSSYYNEQTFGLKIFNNGDSHFIPERHFIIDIDTHEDYIITLFADNDDVVIYSVELYPYIDELTEEWNRIFYKENNISEDCIFQESGYQINECSAQNLSRFIGSKLSGPGININSKNTLYGTPVVTINEINPNILNQGDGGSDGNLRII